jgi:acyl-homoserine-lactone acylase
MIQAHNLDEFIAANSALQMPFFNVIYADRDGHILYVFGGRQPVRQGGDWRKYAGVLDGSNPSLLWTDTFKWSELPRAIDPDFVANSNNPPWTSAFPQTATNSPGKFPKYISPQFMDMRAQNGAGFLSGLLMSGKKLTFADVLSGKESTHMLLADRVLPDLLAAVKLSGDPDALKVAAPFIGAAAWDHNADATSQGAVLFEAWWDFVSNDPLKLLLKDNTINFYSPHPKFRVGWSANAPLDTPYGLDSLNWGPAVAYLKAAALLVQAKYGGLRVPWGDVHRIVLATHDPTFQTTIPLLLPPSNAPQSGADSPFGVLRVLFRFPALDGSNHFWAYSGDGYVQLVEFTKGGAKAQALLGYGNASRPGSPHVTDQLRFFNAKKLRQVFRTRDEVEQHTVSREVVN